MGLRVLTIHIIKVAAVDKEVEPPPKKYYTIMWENKLTDEAVDRTIQQAENSSAEN